MKKNVVLLAAMAMVGIAFTSCKCKHNVAANNTQSLESSSWKLTSMNGDTNTAFAQEGRFTITFDPQKGDANGMGACNRYFAKYKKEDNKIDITVGGSTRMACPDLALEAPFFQMLDAADSYTIKNKQLILSKDGKEVAVFTQTKTN